ncbi:MAG: YbaN family protein [Alistipes sp.]|nr:YbaN family protein [Alistipes sp.]MBQ1958408.1 YbaN family protein [Alistipes sp.]MBQ1980713.1 YbaN family protein [Alistipes sp.]MBQ2415611.1 YbaN family protein [Alistipes sp.]MBQ5623213.1 YbaN family protein [Alistipes sp.]
MKNILAILGVVSLVLGVVGIFLPLLPTTPFLLLSAWLFVRSSPGLYAWLINHPRLGPYIRNFRENRALPLRVKVVSITMVWLTIGFCIVSVVDEYLWVQIVLTFLAVAVTRHILSYDTLKKKD